MGNRSQENIIGYKYFISLHLAICHGPIDTLKKIFIGEKLAYDGDINLPTLPEDNSRQTFRIDSPGLFGGEEKEGGVISDVDIDFGSEFQNENPFLLQKLPTNTTNGRIPSFKGVTSLIVKDGYVGARNPYLKPWAVVAARKPSIPNGNSTLINGGANPSHIIIECLTNPDWGLGIPQDFIDYVSFDFAALTLENEEFGLSLIYSESSPMDEFINLVLDHINAYLYVDLSTGKYVLNLVRKPTQEQIDTAVSFNESNIERIVSYNRIAYSNLVNEVVVTFQPQAEFQESSVTVQDLAGIESQNGQIISQKVDYPGIDNEILAGKVAERDLTELGTPLATLTIVVNSDAFSVVQGGIVKFSNSQLGVENQIFRVISINRSTFDSNQIELELTEDVFSLGLTTYIQNSPTLWEDPIQPAKPILSQRIMEVPYWDIATNYPLEVFNSLQNEDSFVQVFSKKPSGFFTSAYQLWSSYSGTPLEYGSNVGYTPTAILNVDLIQTETVIEISQLDISISSIQTNRYLYINDEAVRLDSILDNGNGTYSITVARGTIDTVPTKHQIGTLIYFADRNDGRDVNDYIAGDSVIAKGLPIGGSDILDISLATQLNIDLIGRQYAPYPPSKVRINNEFFPERAVSYGGVEVVWGHQDRLQQTAQLEDWFNFETGNPETGTTYSLRIYSDSNNGLILAVDDLIVPAYTITEKIEENVRIELWSVRNNVESLQKFIHTLYLVTFPSGIRIVESGDGIKVTSNGIDYIKRTG